MIARALRLRLVFALLLPLAAAINAQLFNLSGFSSSSVQSRKSVPTFVDSLLIESNVDRGLATTVVTMTLRPGYYYQRLKSYDIIDGTRVPAYEYSKPEKVDSIEIRTYMRLPTDFAIKRMWLWVDGRKKEAEIQDRTLARGQYEEIVNRRKDPCLVEFHGEGSYNMSIFPAESNKARKVALELRHTFEDDSLKMVRALLPFLFDTTRAYYPTPRKKQPIGYFKLRCTAGDGNAYTLSLPGITTGSFSRGRPLSLIQRNIYALQPGTMGRKDPSGTIAEYMWSGVDMNNDLTAGFATMLAESTVTFEPEPDTRIIVLDIRKQWWSWKQYYDEQAAMQGTKPWYKGNDEPIDIWLKARKFAVLCLQKYVEKNQKFNLVLSKNGTPSTVFSAPVSPSSTNLERAFKAIKQGKPDAGASTKKLLKTAIDQRNDGVTILISDLFEPPVYRAYYRDRTNDRFAPEVEAYEKFYKDLSAMVKKSRITLFTITDEWRLSNIARESGGFNLAPLRNTYYYDCVTTAEVKSSVRMPAPCRPTLPDLFGYNTYYNRGISDLRVSTDNSQVKNIVFTTDNSNIYRILPMMDVAVGAPEPAVMTDPEPARTDAAIAPGYYPSYKPSALLRVAAHLPQGTASGSYEFLVTGKIGGRLFSKKVRAVMPDAPQASSGDAVQWAFRKSENLCQVNYRDNADLVKKLGMEYHIVTRQTSLLALEWGMEMWSDTMSADNAGTQLRSGAEAAPAADADMAPSAPSPSPDAKSGGSGSNSLDELSLEALIDGATPIADPAAPTASAAPNTLRALVLHRSLVVTLHRVLIAETVTLTLHDAKGQLIASANMSAADLAGYTCTLDLDGHTAHGYYLLTVRADATSRTIKVPLAVKGR